MFDYQAVFERVEESLIAEGRRSGMTEDLIRKELDKSKRVHTTAFSDAECFRKLVKVIFYSGFRAQTVTDRIDTIMKHLGNYDSVGHYPDADERRILSDPMMIRNRAKIRACIENASKFRRIVAEHGSFRNYVNSFSPESDAGLFRLRDDLKRNFAHLGAITVYHFMMDIGLSVLKPDRVLRRIFFRLGLLDTERPVEAQLDKTILQGRRFARDTRQPIRYIDIVFVAYGQVATKKLGLNEGICLGENPRCSFCGIRRCCQNGASSVVRS